MNVRDALLTIAAVAMLVYLRPAWPQTLLDNPSSCKCVPTNWPPAGKWQADSGKGNLGQNFHSEHTEVWTHACASGGTALDEIMFKLFGEEAPSTAGDQGQASPAGMTAIRNVSIYASPPVPDRCSEPYLVPEVYCGDGGRCGRYINDVISPLRVVVDEPSVTFQPGGQGNYYQMQKHFVDFVMCGAEVKDVLQWTRTGIGAQACPGSRTLSSNYQVQTAPTLQTLQTQLCDVARAGGKFQSDGAASFGGVQVYLNCPL
jgi:hypothetical protein